MYFLVDDAVLVPSQLALARVPRGRDAQLISPLAPIGSIELVQQISSVNDRSDMTDRRFAQSPSKRLLWETFHPARLGNIDDSAL